MPSKLQIAFIYDHVRHSQAIFLRDCSGRAACLRPFAVAIRRLHCPMAIALR